MHWWPRQTPKTGISGPNRSITAQEIPASRGDFGPGEITMWSGFIAAISSRVISSWRFTTSFSPISPKYWTRL